MKAYDASRTRKRRPVREYADRDRHRRNTKASGTGFVNSPGATAEDRARPVVAQAFGPYSAFCAVRSRSLVVVTSRCTCSRDFVDGASLSGISDS